MILSGNEIHRQVEKGHIEVSPFEPDHLNPVSLDLTLGAEVAYYKDWVMFEGPQDDGRHLRPTNRILDVRKPLELERVRINPEKGWVIRPGIGYLMHTAERVTTNKFVPVLDGKSSIGRLFIKVHETAGFGDPGFNGQYTLEVTSVHPLRVFPGMRICQIRFHTIEGDVTPYEGNYVANDAWGPVGSKAFKQFE